MDLVFVAIGLVFVAVSLDFRPRRSDPRASTRQGSPRAKQPAEFDPRAAVHDDRHPFGPRPFGRVFVDDDHNENERVHGEDARRELVDMVTYYWHFLGVLWLVLFGVLRLIS